VADQTFQLIVRKGPRPGQLFPLTLETITIGRDPLSDIVLNDSEISRHHAQLQKTKDGYALKDLGSTNGSFVDGKRLGGEAETLSPGQVVMFGSNVTVIYQATSASDPLATMVSPIAAMPSLEPAVEEKAETAAVPEPEIEPEPEPELEPEPDDMGTIIDPSPSFSAPVEPKPTYADPSPPASPPSDQFLEGAARAPFSGGLGSSDTAAEAATPSSVMAASPPPPLADKPPAKSGGIGGLSRNATIAIVVAVILLCCCCLLASLGWLFSSGGYEVDFGAAAIETIAFYAG
jgi:pSer/pThr/pTyr-binding forkhead associated (FHA) protein